MSRWPRPEGWVLPGAVALCLAFSLGLVLHAHSVNAGVDGFPLDDPWIHLTYARNLYLHGSFTYFPGDPSSAGSTSPLYTLLLAAGFAVTPDEKVLSYLLGIISHALFLFAMAGWARRRLGSAKWAGAAVLLVGLDPRVGILSVSGMETSLFLCLVALAFYARSSGSDFVEGSALGLAVWVRPDGLILAVVLAIDRGIERFLLGESGRGERRHGLRWAGPVVALGLGYLGFNQAVGGTWLPNTFAAKTAYYGGFSRWRFLGEEVGGMLAHAGWWLLLPFSLWAVAREAWSFTTRSRGRLRAEAGWVVALILAYLLLLPYSHRFGRYLVPVLPAVAVLGLSALREGLLSFLPDPAATEKWRTRITWAFVVAIAALHGRADLRADEEYSRFCRYHADRHERVGRWLEKNTPVTAVIATHDVGAIAYYSERKIVDIVGVILPEAAAHLGRPDYLEYLADLFRREGVTHLAFLRNWIEVVNVRPLFVADPSPEILEVFAWIPGRSHLMPPAASDLNRQGLQRIQGGDLAGALSSFERSLDLDLGSSRTWLFCGTVHEMARRIDSAEYSYRRALALDPDLHDAMFHLAKLLVDRGELEEARSLVEQLRRARPDYPGVAPLLHRAGGGSSPDGGGDAESRPVGRTR